MPKFYCPKCETYKEEAMVLADAQVRYPSNEEAAVEISTVLEIVGYECLDCGSIDVADVAKFGAGEEVEEEGAGFMDHVMA